MKLLKKLVTSILNIIFIIITVLSILGTVSLSSQEVSFTLIPDPYIDIVLSKGKTNTDVTNFKQDILNALSQQGVNINRVEVSSVETVYNQLSSEDVNVDEIINSWETIGAPTWSSRNGEIYSNSPSCSADFTDNPGVGWTPSDTLAWWGTGLIDPDGYESEEITMDFTMVTGGKLNEGVCFNVTKNSDGSLNGYFVTICNHTDTQCRLWRFDHYTLDQSFSSGINRNMWCHGGSHGSKRDNNSWVVGHTSKFGNDRFTCLAGCTTDSINVKYNISYKNNNIVIKVDNSVVANVTDTKYPKGSYGFWGNNCEAGGLMYISNIRISTVQQNTKKFTEVLREPDWRDGAIKVLVAVEDGQNEELSQSTTLGELLTRLLNENIYFTTWGTNSNKSQFESLIHSNNDNGIFISNTNYTNSINQTAIYIKSLLDSIEQSDNYLILNDQVSINMSPPEAANNTADITYPYGKWKIEHDYNYFENHIGQFAQSGRYIDDFITEFDKTGKYTITYADSTVVPSEVYVHRRPTAILKSVKTGTSISLISNSSDLDSYSQGINGIAQEEWKYKKTTENNWTTGKLTTMDTTSDYVVQLRVKDFQGIWSYPVSIYATNRTDALPIASFGITNREITRYQTLEVIDTSYDPYGGTITSWTWELYKGDSRLYSGSTVPSKSTYNTVGEYTLRLTVKNNRGLTSETYSRTFEVIEDNIPPSVTIEPLSCTWTQSVDVNLQFYDDGGSGFKHYKYAITDSQATPRSWSSNITSVNGKVTINTDGIKYLHIIAEDNAGNVSEDRIAGPYYIDKTAPSMTVTPQNSDWAQETQVQVSFSDGGGGFKHYRYAITDSRDPPTTWSDYITKSTDTITINTETEKYLHIIAEDNIGNVTADNVTGPYFIDRTNPTIQVIGDLQTIVIDELTLNLQANDVPSGVETFKLDGEIIFNGNHTFYKNGKHTLEAVDKAGNTYSTEFEITNIYYECDAGLEHPIYSSTYDSCPICESYKGLTVTNSKDIYNSDKQGVKYDNPRGAEIVEYYDGVKENPENVKEYDYELKVVYEGNEYKTGVLGKYTITPKIITIEDIVATNKVYNGNTTVVVSGGRLIDVCEGDNLYFELPATGEAESRNVGEWKVSIAEIKLLGDDAPNYILKHPTYGDIMVEITPRALRVINLSGKNRIYNKETTVDIIGGEFDNLVEGDDVVPTIPATGESESSNTGTWRVAIEDIALSGKDVPNYTFTQPEYGEIMVTISREIGQLVIECNSKKYDRDLIEPYIVEKNTTSEVTYKYYKAGTDEEVERPYDLGKYDVVGYAETDGNYTEVESNKVTFEITKPDAPMIGIESRVIKVNEQMVAVDEQPAEIQYGDLVTIEIRIRNEGLGSGYAKEVTSTIADGMEFVEDNETNKANGWKLDGKKVTTDKYSYETDINNELYPKRYEYEQDNENQNNIDNPDNPGDTDDSENIVEEELENGKESVLNIIPDDTTSDSGDNNGDNSNNEGNSSDDEETSSEEVPSEENPTEESPSEEEENQTEEEEAEINTGIQKLQLVLRVTKNDKTHHRLLSQITVEQQDKRGDIIEYTKENEENSKNRVEMQYTYTDLQIEKRITQIITTDKTTNTVKKYDIYQKPGNIVKLELPSKNIGNTKLDIIYEIKLKNVGDHNANIDQIVDIMPNGVTFSKEGNEGWYVGENGHIVYDNFEDYLRPNEEKSIKLKLTYDLDEGGMAQIENDAYLLATEDLDERIITDEGSIKIEETNDYAKSELIVSVITGETIIIYLSVILGGMLIVVAGISLIKKYIL